jgi:putative transposase
MVESLAISERRACRYAGLSRTSYREPPRMDQAAAELSARIVTLAHERLRFGYRRIHDLLALEGHQVNHKRVWRLYKMANLSVRKRRKVKKVTGEWHRNSPSKAVVDSLRISFQTSWIW